jgi:hypothetical protein
MDYSIVIPEEARHYLNSLVALDGAIAKKETSFKNYVDRMITCLKKVIIAKDQHHAEALWTFLVEEKEEVRKNNKNLSQMESKKSMERWRRAMKKIIGQLKFQGINTLYYSL